MSKGNISESLHDSLSPQNKPCNICSTPYSEDDFWVLGYIGILPVSFCEICYNGIVEMVHELEESDDFDETN